MTDQELHDKLNVAETGDSAAMNDIGVHYYQLQDYPQAYLWFSKSAEKDNIWAIGNLGLLYECGLGVEKDLNKAFEYYKNAACRDFGLQWAAGQLNSMGQNYQNGTNGFPNDESLACKCYKASAEGKDANGMCNYGFFLQYGKGTEVDTYGACQWYQKSASYNNIYGLANYAYCCENGVGTEIDYEDAYLNYYEAIDNGNDQDWVRAGMERTRDKWIDKCYEILLNDDKVLEEGETLSSIEHSTKTTAALKRARCYELGIGGAVRNLQTAIDIYWPFGLPYNKGFSYHNADKNLTEKKLEKIKHLQNLQKRELFAPEFEKAEAGDFGWQCVIARAFACGKMIYASDGTDARDSDFYFDEQEAKKWAERVLHNAQGEDLESALNVYINYISRCHDKYKDLDECITDLYRKYGDVVYFTDCKYEETESWIEYFDNKCRYIQVLRAANAFDNANKLDWLRDNDFVIVSNCYRYGRGTVKDLDKALLWLNKWKSTFKGNITWRSEEFNTCNNMIKCLEEDIQNATITETQKKADNGDAQAACLIGLWYKNGENGYTEDWEQAKIWLQKSAAQGNQAALAFYQEICNEQAEVKAEMERFANEIREKAQKKLIEMERELEYQRDRQRMHEERAEQERQSKIWVTFEWEFYNQTLPHRQSVEMNRDEYYSILSGGYSAIEIYIRGHFCQSHLDNKPFKSVKMKTD